MSRQANDDVDLSRAIGAAIRTGRRESGWSQDELARRLGASQSMVSRLEAGGTPFIDASLASRALAVLGVNVAFDARTLGRVGRREQRDLVHAACAGYVARRLIRAGWIADLEVEIGSGRFRGWIDVLAYREFDRRLLVGEIKTEIVDVGGIQRTLRWYEREAWTAARAKGWRPRTSAVALLLLASKENDARAQANRSALKATCPANGRDLAEWVSAPSARSVSGSVAMVDPRSRGDVWLRSTRSDGRRSAAPYLDYADAARRLRSTR